MNIRSHLRALPRDLRQVGVAEYQLFALDVVGTDPSAAINFERTVMTAEGPKPFGIAAFEIVGGEAPTTPSTTSRLDVQAQWESIATRGSEFRAPLLEYRSSPTPATGASIAPRR